MKKIKIQVILLLLTVMLVPALLHAQTIVPNPTADVIPKVDTIPGNNGVTITQILTNIMNWLLGILGMLGIIGFIISGILYLTSAGNDDQIQRAKKAMTYSIIGIIVGMSGVIIIMAVQAMLNGSSKF